MSQLAFWFLLILGLIMLISNIVKGRKAGQPRPIDEQKYPSGAWYAIDAILGFCVILIAFGVI